jgi:pyruvate/2-oxoglutarate dehydrogenase complex dihydrolipoamide acyltransferase (E2) component
VRGLDLHPVIPAKAGTHEHGVAGFSGRRRSWAPAFAGVTPLALAPFLAACQQATAPANNQAAAPVPQKAAAESDVSAAQRLVRARLGGGGDVQFRDVHRSASDGVPIVCGTYAQGGRTQRYIVVNGEDAFVEPQMQPGEMDRANAEFCGEGHDNRPPPATPAPAPGNAQ